jgi:hypothetical protein
MLGIDVLKYINCCQHKKNQYCRSASSRREAVRGVRKTTRIDGKHKLVLTDSRTAGPHSHFFFLFFSFAFFIRVL